MDPTFTHGARRRLTALLGVIASIALVLGLAPAASAADDAGDISVYVAFEGYNLGQGYYVEPVKLTVPAGQTAAQVTESVLDQTNHAVSPDPGDPRSGGWYLQGVAGFDTGTVKAPSYITGQSGFELTAANSDGYLGTPDYNSMSGWMFTVDNIAADVGAGSYALKDGDVVRWQFTLYGYGCDLGVPSACFGSDPYFTMVDKSDLIRATVDADPANATSSELAAARGVAINPTATQAQVTAAIDALKQPQPAEKWIDLTTTAQGQVLAKLQAALVSDYGQTAGSYDYSVAKRLRIAGPVNSADFTALRNTAYAGTRIEKLDLSAAVTSSLYALNGMTSLTDVLLPSVAAVTVPSLFSGDTALENVTLAAATITFGSSTLFNGATSLKRITFLRGTAPPTFSATTFNGSNNASADARVVVAAVPDKTSGGYQLSGFKQYFSDVVDLASNPPASSDERTALRSTIDEAGAIDRISAYNDERWAALQTAKTTGQAVLDDAGSTSGAVTDARTALRTAIDSLLGLSFRVTKGADVGLYQKGSLHFAPFTRFDLTKITELSDADYDVYVPAATLANGTYNVSGSINGETDKVVRIFSVTAATNAATYKLDLTKNGDREDTPLLIPGSGAGDVRGLYTNLDDTGTVDLEVGETFNLDTMRTTQGQNDATVNYFIEPDYAFDVSGDSISTQRIGSEGRRRLAITATKPGVSVVKISYGPLKYIAANGTTTDFNAIEKQNTGLVVVNVGGSDASFSTGITSRNDLDTYYFDKSIGYRDFTFTPAEGTSVRVHDPLNVTSWGDGWTTYQPDEDGAFSVKLKGGRNIVELTHDGAVEQRVVRAKGIDIAIANSTDPGKPFEPGDNAQLALKGVEGGVEKLAGIYNPGFAAGTRPKLTYTDGTTSISSNEAGQYNSATTTYTLNYAFGGGADETLAGYLSIGGLGEMWPYHREIPATGKPANLNALPFGPYQVGALPSVYVYDDQVSTRPERAPVDQDVLRTALEQAEKLDAGRYTAASWTALHEAVDIATAVSADQNATQAEVDDAVKGINDAVAALAMKGAAPPAPAVAAATAAAQRAGAGWLADQLAANEDVLGRAGSTDWGLTIDAVFALAGAKVGGTQIAETAAAVYASQDAYVGGPDEVASSWPYMAKAVLALQVAGLDPTTFPDGDRTRDLIAELRSAIRPDGSWTNATDPFKTSLGILALARTKQGVPAAAVSTFEQKACSDASHANYGAFGFGASCSSADVDTTAMAVQALIAAGVSNDDRAVSNATAWLAEKQGADGGFPSPYGPGNTNSGGLAAEALYAAGHTAVATKAASFVETLQIGCSTVADEKVTDPEVVSSLTSANGAIAYDAEAWNVALEDGIGSTNLDQWRRATAQAVLGLGAESLGFISADDATAGVPSTPCPGPVDSPPTATSVTASAGTVVYGKAATVNVTVKAPSGSQLPSGVVSTRVGSKTITAKVSAGSARISLPLTSLKPGRRSLTISYAGVPELFTASSRTIAVKVVKATPRVTVKASKKVKRGKTATYTVTVSAPGVKPTGKVTVKVGGKSKTVRLTSKGKAVVKIRIARSAKPGKKAVTVTYKGSSYVASGKAKSARTVVTR